MPEPQTPNLKPSPETAHPRIRIVSSIELQALALYRDAYASLYVRLAEALRATGSITSALGLIDSVWIESRPFADAIASLRLSSNIHGFADEYETVSLSKGPAPFAESREPELIFEDEDAAYEYLRAKTPLTKAQFALLGAHAAADAITVTGLTQQTIRNLVKPALLDALNRGVGLDEFCTRLADQPFGVPGRLTPELHMEIVYRTNIMTAYNWAHLEAGMDPSVAAFYPGAYFLVILDKRTSTICRPLAGKYVSRFSVITGEWCPPFHYSCRTGIAWASPDEYDKAISGGNQLPEEYWQQAQQKVRKLTGFGTFRSRIWQ